MAQEQESGALDFHPALDGDKKAVDELAELERQELEYLDGAIALCGQLQWLAERSPEIALVFEAVKGDDGALKRLKRKKTNLGRLAAKVRELFQATGLGEPADLDGEGVFSDRTSADVGLLVGEQHLRQGEYLLALEAFTRSLQTSPTPDAYETGPCLPRPGRRRRTPGQRTARIHRA